MQNRLMCRPPFKLSAHCISFHSHTMAFTQRLHRSIIAFIDALPNKKPKYALRSTSFSSNTDFKLFEASYWQ